MREDWKKQREKWENSNTGGSRKRKWKEKRWKNCVLLKNEMLTPSASTYRGEKVRIDAQVEKEKGDKP